MHKLQDEDWGRNSSENYVICSWRRVFIVSIVYSVFVYQELEMGPAGVSSTLTISDQRSYIKIATLRRKNPIQIHDALGEVSGEFTVERSTVCRWVNRFRGGCVCIDNDPRLWRPRTSSDERSVKLVADALEGDSRETCEELSRATRVKMSQENAHESTSVAPGWVTHSPWQCSPAHCGCYNKKKSRLWVGSVTSCALQSRHECTRLLRIPKVKRTYAWMMFFFSGRAFRWRYPSYSTHE